MVQAENSFILQEVVRSTQIIEDYFYACILRTRTMQT